MYEEKSFQQWPFRRTEVKEIVNTVIGGQKSQLHPKLDLVNMVVRTFLFTKLSLFTKSSIDKE